VEKILNKRKLWKVEKYLVHWKGFMAENDIWEKEKNLENARKLVEEFKGRLSAKVRRQERIEKRWKVQINSEAEEFKRGRQSVTWS